MKHSVHLFLIDIYQGNYEVPELLQLLLILWNNNSYGTVWLWWWFIHINHCSNMVNVMMIVQNMGDKYILHIWNKT